jgi:20S proteasome subunit alpha 7
MSAAGFDQNVTCYSADGRLFQIEYSEKAMENGDTIVGVKCSDGIILGVEKYMHSVLQVPDTNPATYTIDTHIGAIISGKIPDGRNVIQRAIGEAEGYRNNYGVPIPTHILAQRISSYYQVHTCYHGARPLGCAIILAGHDGAKDALNQNNGKDSLYMIEPSGKVYGYKACTSGKNRQITRPELEKGDFASKTCREALPLVSKMLSMGNKDAREKRFEFEASWICSETNRVHKSIDKLLRNDAKQWAEEEIEKEAYGDEED